MPYLKIILANLFRFLKQISGFATVTIINIILRYYLPASALPYFPFIAMPLFMLVFPKKTIQNCPDCFILLIGAIALVGSIMFFEQLAIHGLPWELGIAYVLYIVAISFMDWFRNQIIGE
jgi:hypothetical protein